jgi:preprotein translocase subunit SecG
MQWGILIISVTAVVLVVVAVLVVVQRGDSKNLST